MYASYLRSAPILLRRRIDLDLQQHRERKSYVQRPAPAPQPLPDSGISSVVATSLIGRALFSDLDDFSEDTRYSKLVSHGVLRSGQTQAAIRADSTATAASSVPAYQAPFPIHFDGPGMTDVLRDILMADDVASPSSAASAAAALSPKDAPPSPGAGSHSRDAEAVDTDSGDEVSASVSRKPSGAISAAAGAGGVPGQGLLEALSLSSRGAMVDINFGEMDTEVGEFTTVSRRSGAGSVGNASLTAGAPRTYPTTTARGSLRVAGHDLSPPLHEHVTKLSGGVPASVAVAADLRAHAHSQTQSHMRHNAYTTSMTAATNGPSAPSSASYVGAGPARPSYAPAGPRHVNPSLHHHHRKGPQASPQPVFFRGTGTSAAAAGRAASASAARHGLATTLPRPPVGAAVAAVIQSSPRLGSAVAAAVTSASTNIAPVAASVAAAARKALNPTAASWSPSSTAVEPLLLEVSHADANESEADAEAGYHSDNAVASGGLAIARDGDDADEEADDDDEEGEETDETEQAEHSMSRIPTPPEHVPIESSAPQYQHSAPSYAAAAAPTQMHHTVPMPMHSAMGMPPPQMQMPMQMPLPMPMGLPVGMVAAAAQLNGVRPMMWPVYAMAQHMFGGVQPLPQPLPQSAPAASTASPGPGPRSPPVTNVFRPQPQQQ